MIWHPTNDHGEIELPPAKLAGPEQKAPMTLQQELNALAQICEMLHKSDEERDDIAAKLVAKFAAKEAAENGADAGNP